MAEPTNDKHIGQRLGSALRERDWAGVLIELAIVMVGVFLGIEATNWNQARQDRAQEKRYYAQIVVDLRRDVETLQDSQRLSRDHDAAAETVIHAMDDGISAGMPPSDFASTVQLAGFLYIPSPTRRTYDELISTGNLRLLRDGGPRTPSQPITKPSPSFANGTCCFASSKRIIGRLARG